MDTNLTALTVLHELAIECLTYFESLGDAHADNVEVLRDLIASTNGVAKSTDQALIDTQAQLVAAMLGGLAMPRQETQGQIDFALMKSQLIEANTNLNDFQLALAEKKANLDATIEKLKATFEATNAELIAIIDYWNGQASEIEREIRDSILVEYAKRGEKQIFAGLSVRINKSYVFEDRAAVDWAIERRMPELLKPDATAFKKQMALTPQDFCTVTETASAVVSLKK